MGSPLTLLVKHKIIAECQSGRSLNSISSEMKVSYGAVWTLWNRYAVEGSSALSPRYGNNGRKGSDRNCLVFRAACWLKRRYPEWGSPVIRVILQDRYGKSEAIASARQMNRWFIKSGLSHRGSKIPTNPKEWAREVHEIWQVDAKENVGIDSGDKVCWLTVADEKSGALVAAPPFPPREDLPGSIVGLQAGPGGNISRKWPSQLHEG